MEMLSVQEAVTGILESRPVYGLDLAYTGTS